MATKTTPKTKSFKKKATKLKGVKLEDRIAPGMVGGGVVDPGLSDVVEQDSAEAPGGVSQDAKTTEIESAPSDSTPTEGRLTAEDSDLDDRQEDARDSDDTDQAAEAQDYSGLGDSADADFVSEGAAWQQPEWVNMNADGSAHVELPAGVEIDDGVANFPADAAAEALPDGVSFSESSGAAVILLPPTASIDVDAGTVTLPPDSPLVEAIPEALPSHENPDGSFTVTLPQDGVTLDPEANTVEISNNVVNALAPDNITVNEDGSVDVELPPDAEVSDDGSLDLTPEQVQYMDNPPPAYLDEVDWAEVNADGSVTITPPEEVTIEDGEASIPLESANEILPLPEAVELNEDGTMSVSVPEETRFDEASSTLTFPQDGESGLTYENIPTDISAHVNPDNTVSVELPAGITYDAETHTVNLDNYWANQVTPPNLVITSGAAVILMPPHFSFDAEGNITIPADSTDFMADPSPEFVAAGPEYITETAQGDVLIAPSDSFTADPDTGTVTLSTDTVNEDFGNLLPENVTLTPEGTMEVALPEGTEFNEETATLTFPEGTVHPNEIPNGMEAEVNEDGSVSATVPSGITYDEQTNTVTLDNHWTNEVLPSAVQVTPDGEVVVALPEGTEISEDGSVQIPAEETDFLENPDPDYAVYGPDYVEANTDGSVAVSPPAEAVINAEEGTLTLPAETVNEDFGSLLPFDANLTPEGTLEATLPEGTSYNPDDHTVTFPEGSINLQQIPEGIAAIENDNGTVTAAIPDGVTYDTESNSVTLDNYWTNEVLPENVSVSEEGSVTVELPENTQFFGDAGFTIPADSADFLDNPDPAYVTQGPEWAEANPDGSVTLTPPESVEVDPLTETLTLDVTTAAEEFSELIPEGVTLNSDGSITVAVPEGTQFNPQNDTLTFPPGEIHVDEIPPEASPSLNDDGSITATLPEGVTFDAEAHTVNIANEVVDAVLPINVDLDPSGQITVTLPDNTLYQGEAEITIPANSANVLQDPEPVLVSETPAAAQQLDEAEEGEEDVLSDREAQRWDRIEGKVDRWLEKLENQLEDGKRLPDDIDQKWNQFDERAEKFLETHAGAADIAERAGEWDALEDRANQILEKWEDADEKNLDNRFDSYEKGAEKLLDRWESQLDRWEARADQGQYGEQFDDRIETRLNEMESRWERMDGKVDAWLGKWSGKNDLAENRGDWQKIETRMEDLFGRIRDLKSKLD